MSSAASLPMNQDGPLMWMAEALQCRLQAIFPPAYFDFAFMPAKADRRWFERYFRRGPGIALGWNGITAAPDEGGVFTGTAHWTVALFTKNASGVQPRYMGDNLAPGLFAMARVASLMLHGYLIDPDGTPWTATGTCKVGAIGNLYNEDWGDNDTAICGLEISILYEETLPPGLELTPSNSLLVESITWNFGEQPPLLTSFIDTSNPGANA